MKYQVNLTEEDISKAEALREIEYETNICSRCPVAIALQRTIGIKSIMVGFTCFNIDGGTEYYDIPRNAHMASEAFTLRGVVKPITFEVEIP